MTNRYLSAEQRRNYLIRIDDKGKLRWVNNDRLVDTQKGKHKDAGPNKGIVDVEEGHGKEEVRGLPNLTFLGSSARPFRNRREIRQTKTRADRKRNRNINGPITILTPVERCAPSPPSNFCNSSPG